MSNIVEVDFGKARRTAEELRNEEKASASSIMAMMKIVSATVDTLGEVNGWGQTEVFLEVLLERVRDRKQDRGA